MLYRDIFYLLKNEVKQLLNSFEVPVAAALLIKNFCLPPKVKHKLLKKKIRFIIKQLPFEVSVVLLKYGEVLNNRRHINLDLLNLRALNALSYNNNLLIMASNQCKINPNWHSEILLLETAFCLKKIISFDSKLTTLYCTLEPCLMCAQFINNFRLGKVVFGAYNVQEGGVAHNNIINLNYPYYGGIGEVFFKQALLNFFKLKR